MFMPSKAQKIEKCLTSVHFYPLKFRHPFPLLSTNEQKCWKLILFLWNSLQSVAAF